MLPIPDWSLEGWGLLVAVVGVIGAFIFSGVQVYQASRSARDAREDARRSDEHAGEMQRKLDLLGEQVRRSSEDERLFRLVDDKLERVILALERDADGRYTGRVITGELNVTVPGPTASLTARVLPPADDQ